MIAPDRPAHASSSLDLGVHLARSQVVLSAVQVFGRLGFAGTRVEDLLLAAGIARRTFYKYFRSKEDVLAAVYELATDQLVKAIRSAGPPGELPLEAITRGIDIYLDFHVDNAALLRVLVEQAIRVDSRLFALRLRFRRELVKLLSEGTEAATGRRHDEMLYAALISALEGVSLDLLSEGATPSDVERAKRVMRELLARSLA